MPNTTGRSYNKGNNSNPNGRPKRKIEWAKFEKLCAVLCTKFEIASILNVCEDTLDSRVKDHYKNDFSTVYKQFASNGTCSLRRNQFVLSQTNASMSIWLGKQWLGQKDNDDRKDNYANDASIADRLAWIKAQGIIEELIEKNKELEKRLNEFKQEANPVDQSGEQTI